jgi:hypothetical protein
MINKDNTCDYGTIKGGTQNILEMIFLKKKKKKKMKDAICTRTKVGTTTCTNKVEGKISYTLIFVINTWGMGDEKGMVTYTLL